ncbi:MAG: OsmC family protein [Hyphomicrobiaceae bacterium]
MEIKRSASARWSGGLKDGRGSISTQSGVLRDQPYGYATRFENDPGTNPEELIGAAHAGCFTMALSLILAQSGHAPERLETNALVTLKQTGQSFEISAVHLVLEGEVPNIDAGAFRQAAETAKSNCPVSKLLNAEITLDAKLTK